MKITTAALNSGSVDIDGGTIDNTVIGGATPAAGSFTTISATGQITSTLANGTAPFVVTSSTVVANLKAATAGNADTVTTNANLTGAVTSVGNATSLGSFTSANLAAAVSDETGSGALVFANTPTLVTPVLGAATATSISFGAEALSVYDEGTWTPTWTGMVEVPGGGSISYSGKYTKIGNMVTWTVRVDVAGGATTASTAGTTFINNMPFTIGSIESICGATNAGTVASYGNGIGNPTTTQMFTPTWGAASNDIIISGSYLV